MIRRKITRRPSNRRQQSDFHIIMMSVTGIKTEYKFHPTRRWRFDYYHPETKTAFEYEGIIAAKSRHTSLTGYTGDCDKYNAAAQMGIKVFRFTPLNYQSIIHYLP